MTRVSVAQQPALNAAPEAPRVYGSKEMLT
jgi:hypothetical protein